jgi:ABC-type nitrate/sulfonate/bicarbonate transport system substrate-binding protein
MLRSVVNHAAHRSSPLCKSTGGTAFAAATNSNSNFFVLGQQQPQQRRGKHTTVALQLDYYMSPQFAGIACAMVEGLYEAAGIHALKILSTCPVGLEPERVRQFRDIGSSADVVVGSIEQNVLLPTLLKQPSLKVNAVAAMFAESPLCLVSLNKKDKQSNNGEKEIVGAHEDTVDLLKRILIYDNYEQDPKHSVVVTQRATKITDLLQNKLDAIQAYTTTEVLTLQRIIEAASGGEYQKVDLETIPLEGHNGAKLGYSQVLFAPEEDLASDENRAILKAFLKATFEGWDMASNDSEHGARCVEEAQAMLQLSDEGNDHWDRRQFSDYNAESTRACSELVNATKKNGSKTHGVIDPERWDEATKWLLNENLRPGFGLDPTVWQAEN